MKIALHTSSLGNYDLEQALFETSRLGFEYVELAADISVTPHFSAHTAGPSEIAHLSTLLYRYSLRLSAIDIGGWDSEVCIVNLDEGQRTAAVEGVKHAVGVAAELGCNLVTSHLWGLPKKHSRDPIQRYAKLFMDSTTELRPVLEKTGVRMAFMPHPGGLVEESDAAVDLLKTSSCDQIGYIYGTGHSSIMCRPEQDTAQMIKYANETLTHVSVSDSHDTWRIVAPPEVGAHEHSALGSGDVDFPEIFRALKEIGFDGFLSAHLISEMDRIEQAAVQTKRELEKLLGP